MQLLPITSKLNPFGGMRNVVYLAEVAALTRLATGVVRSLQNHPDKLNNPGLTPNQKRQTFGERIFVEIVGTAGYIFLLHLGQDLTSKLFEAKAKIPVLNREGLQKQGIQLSDEQIAKANGAIQDTFGPHGGKAGGQGLTYRVLYGDSIKRNGQNIVQKANLTTLHEKLGSELFHQVRPAVEPFAKFANRSASLSILGGVALSALYGGVVTQAANDHVVAPLLKRLMVWRYGEDGSGANTPKQGKPTSGQPASDTARATGPPPATMPTSTSMTLTPPAANPSALPSSAPATPAVPAFAMRPLQGQSR